jgi:NTP pyrophosphatase (non-canonical NTP hydrolase)
LAFDDINVTPESRSSGLPGKLTKRGGNVSAEQDPRPSDKPNDQPNDQPNDHLSVMLQEVQAFCQERDWDQYHDAKELAIGLVTESSELLEHFRFRSSEEFEQFFSASQATNPKMADKRVEIEDELADILFFLLRFAGRYKVDLSQALLRKIEKNRQKYPIEKSRGSNKKYDEF